MLHARSKRPTSIQFCWALSCVLIQPLIRQISSQVTFPSAPPPPGLACFVSSADLLTVDTVYGNADGPFTWCGQYKADITSVDGTRTYVRKRGKERESGCEMGRHICCLSACSARVVPVSMCFLVLDFACVSAFSCMHFCLSGYNWILCFESRCILAWWLGL